MSKPETLNKHTVAVIDILGFSASLKKYGTINVKNSFEDFCRGLDATVERYFRTYGLGDKRPVRYNFSDTIIFFSGDDTDLACRGLIHYAKTAMQLLILRNFMVRGAVTFGEMYINTDKQIFIGEPLVRADKLEKSQNWIGAIIDKSVETNFKKLFEENYINITIPHQESPVKIVDNTEYICYDKIPFKEGCGIEGEFYAINLLDEYEQLPGHMLYSMLKSADVKEEIDAEKNKNNYIWFSDIEELYYNGGKVNIDDINFFKQILPPDVSEYEKFMINEEVRKHISKYSLNLLPSCN